MDIVVDSAAGDSMAMLDAAVCMPMADSYVGVAQEQGGAAAQRAALQPRRANIPADWERP